MNWMSNMYLEYGEYKLNEIMLPGTHDSGAYQLMGCVGCLPLVGSWTLTQDVSIMDQLKMGVRVLDLRVSRLNKEYYVSHTFKCVLLNEVLKEIREFQNNGGEIVIIMVKPDWHHRDTIDMDKLSDHIKYTLDENRVKVYKESENFTGDVSYKDLVLGDTKTIILCNKSSIWLNKSKREDYMLEYYKTTLDKSKYNILDFVLTPDKEYIIKNILSSLRRMSESLNMEFEGVLLNDWNVINVDYIDEKQIKKIIYKNQKFLSVRKNN